MKLTNLQIDRLFTAIEELLQYPLAPLTVYKLSLTHEVLHQQLEILAKAIKRIDNDKKAYPELLAQEVDLNVEMLQWNELPERLKGTIVMHLLPILDGKPTEKGE